MKERVVTMNEDIDLGALSTEVLYTIGSEADRTAKRAKARADEVKRELRRRLEPGEHEFTAGKVLVSKPARQFHPNKVWELFDPNEVAEISRPVPQRDLFERNRTSADFDLVSTFEQARITFK